MRNKILSGLVCINHGLVFDKLGDLTINRDKNNKPRFN